MKLKLVCFSKCLDGSAGCPDLKNRHMLNLNMKKIIERLLGRSLDKREAYGGRATMGDNTSLTPKIMKSRLFDDWKKETTMHGCKINKHTCKERLELMV